MTRYFDRIWTPGTDPGPLAWRKPCLALVAVPGRLGTIALGVMRKAARHTFLLLTDHPELLTETEMPKNVLLGTTIRTQAEADERIPHLLRCPAARRFVVVQPRERVSLDEWLFCERCRNPGACGRGAYETPLDNAAGGCWFHLCRCSDLSWLIVAGETGRDARPLHPDWVRGLRDEAQAAGVPFWFDGWGDWFPAVQEDEDSPKPLTGRPEVLIDSRTGSISRCASRFERGCPCDCRHTETSMVRVGSKASGRILDGREWCERPEVSERQKAE